MTELDQEALEKALRVYYENAGIMSDETTIEAAITAYLAHENRWRDMDSAPQDGTRVLLAVPRSDYVEVMAGHWAGDNYPFWERDCAETEPVKPTAWQPIPTAPHRAK